MANTYKSYFVDLTTTNKTLIYTVPALTTAIVKTIQLTNESGAGYLSLFNPASTTYVKHFIGTSNSYRGDDPISYVNYVAGYGNTTSAVNAVRFQMSTGNFDGTILMYGIV